jgi:TrwC relaxase
MLVSAMVLPLCCLAGRCCRPLGTGELLGRPHGRNAVPAFDVVVRPTKSVSILHGLGDSATGRAVLAAHQAALAEAVAYLDEHLGARRGHGGAEHWPAGAHESAQAGRG